MHGGSFVRPRRLVDSAARLTAQYSICEMDRSVGVAGHAILPAISGSRLDRRKAWAAAADSARASSAGLRRRQPSFEISWSWPISKRQSYGAMSRNHRVWGWRLVKHPGVWTVAAG